MNLNFRLAYNSGYDYVDLLPVTTIEAIKFAPNIMKRTFVDVTIPAFTGLTQTIPLSLTDKQAKAAFDVELLDNTIEAEQDYWTIDQIETKEGNLIITRLGLGSNAPINVRLYFMERGI